MTLTRSCNTQSRRDSITYASAESHHSTSLGEVSDDARCQLLTARHQINMSLWVADVTMVMLNASQWDHFEFKKSNVVVASPWEKVGLYHWAGCTCMKWLVFPPNELLLCYVWIGDAAKWVASLNVTKRNGKRKENTLKGKKQDFISHCGFMSPGNFTISWMEGRPLRCWRSSRNRSSSSWVDFFDSCSPLLTSEEKLHQVGVDLSLSSGESRSSH